MNEKVYCLMAAMFAIILLAGLSYGDAQATATRVLPEFVDPDTPFQVAINIDVDENNPPQVYILYEKFPPGLTLDSADPLYTSFDEASRKIIWVVTDTGSELGDQVYTYTLYASDPGTYAFNGVLKVGDESFTTEGNIVVKVRDNCTENWVCGYWSECAGGEQTRLCEDQNGCMFPVSVPEMSRSCTEEEETTQEEDNTPETQDTEDDATEDTQEQPDEVEEETGTGSGQSQGEATEDQSGEEEDPVNEMTNESEQETGEEKITGHATNVIDEQNQPEVLTESEADVEPTEEAPEDINKVPLFTKVLCFVLVAEVIVLALRK